MNIPLAVIQTIQPNLKPWLVAHAMGHGLVGSDTVILQSKPQRALASGSQLILVELYVLEQDLIVDLYQEYVPEAKHVRPPGERAVTHKPVRIAVSLCDPEIARKVQDFLWSYGYSRDVDRRGRRLRRGDV